ncbi:MAG: hypothetical protein HC817_01125 [Saprospiraceae bacterium]|nr:hypothetical protein [Saprospiraceae bacterium]
MAVVSETLDSIEQKIRLLTTRLENFERDVAILKQQNRALQTDLLLRDSEISHLKNALIVSTEAKEPEVHDIRENINDDSFKSSERKHQLRLEIDRYIRQIDECVETLQQF